MAPYQFNHYNFTSNKICRRECIASDTAAIIFGDSINVDFYNGKLVIGEDASLAIGDDVTIHSHGEADSLIIYGQFDIGRNVCFIADQDTALVIEIRNPDLDLQLDQAFFKNVDLSFYNDTLDIDNSHFTQSNLRFFRTSEERFILTNSVLDTTILKVTVDELSEKDMGTVVISDCDVTSNLPFPAIEIEVYKEYELLRDTLCYTNSDGISIYYSGSSTGQIHSVKNCSLQYLGSNPQDTIHGLMIYRSYADIETNYISGNTFGVGCMNMSNIRLIGDENASEQDETQQIIENDTNQVYILPGSFPYEFEYNVIYRTENDDSLVYLNTPVTAYEKYLHVENNHWGAGGLDTVHGLIPSLKYFWDPVWVPDWIKSTPIDKELFLDARQAIMDQDYALAESNTCL